MRSAPRPIRPRSTSRSVSPSSVTAVVRVAEVALDDLLEVLVEERPDRLGQVLVAEDLVALGVDRLALLVDDVVELDDALAHVEVEALDAALRALDRLADDARLDVVVLVEAHPLHEPGDTLRGEALHQVVVERQVEARRAGVALAAGAAPELVVDAPALVALRAHDVQAARLDDAPVVLLGDRLRLREGRLVGVLVHLGRVEALAVEQVGGETRRVAAEQDVRPAAGHVGGDRDGAGPARLGDDPDSFSWNLAFRTSCLIAAPLEQRRRASPTSRPTPCRRGSAGPPPASPRSRRSTALNLAFSLR